MSVPKTSAVAPAPRLTLFHFFTRPQLRRFQVCRVMLHHNRRCLLTVILLQLTPPRRTDSRASAIAHSSDCLLSPHSSHKGTSGCRHQSPMHGRRHQKRQAVCGACLTLHARCHSAAAAACHARLSGSGGLAGCVLCDAPSRFDGH